MNRPAENQPLVTVNILSFNRKNDLRNTLQKVYEQDYKNIEVIVVDNASTDGTPEMVEKEFPEVKLIRLEKNIGIAGWNKGFEAAKGEYVLVLDDDSYPLEETIARAVRKMNVDENIGIVACNIFNTSMNFNETENWPENPYSFVGCGALIDRKKLDKVGYFDENIFIYLNELDLTARFLNAGFKVLFLNECKIIHAQSFASRGKARNPFASRYRFEHFFWSMSYFLLTKFSFPFIIFPFFKWVTNRMLIAIRYFYLLSFFKQLMKIGFSFPLIFRNRRVLNKEIQRFYNYGNIFAWIDRDYFGKFLK